MDQGLASQVSSFFKHVVPFKPHLSAPGRQFLRTRATFIAVALGVIALLAVGDVARAENECGPPEPGKELVCLPSNYDPSDGNIFYGPDKASTDITIRLTEGLSVNYDRNNPGDDVYVPPEDPGNPRYSAVWITPTETGYGYKGDITLYSSADVTSNGRGISVGHYGESGALRMELSGGAITTTGPLSWAVHSYHGGEGALNVDVRGSAISTTGESTIGILGAHVGTGVVNIRGHNLTVSAAGALSSGIRGQHNAQGGINILLQGGAITTEGEDGTGIVGSHSGEGDVAIDARGLTISGVGESVEGIWGQHTGQGGIDIQVQGGGLTTEGENGAGIVGIHGGEGDVAIDARGLTISGVGENVDGIRGQHNAQGGINILLQGGAITTEGEDGTGIVGSHSGEGDVAIDARGLTISGVGESVEGIWGQHTGQGGIDIQVQGGAITTEGEDGTGIVGSHSGEGDVAIDARGLTISGVGENVDGIWGQHQGEGDINIDVRGIDIVVKGEKSFGITGFHAGTGNIDISAQNFTIAAGELSHNGILGRHDGMGDIDIEVQGGAITVMGTEADGIRGAHLGAGHVSINVRDVTIASQSTELDPERGDTYSVGVYGSHEGLKGDIDISVRGGSITTRGVNSYGVYGQYENPTDDDDNPLFDSDNNVIEGRGDITIAVTGGEISTQGEGSHGIYAAHESGMGGMRITVDGDSIHAHGTNASGIQVGRLDEEGLVEGTAAFGEDGYRRQSVAVNGRVTGGSGDAAGVFLAGGGRVVVGPRGSVGAASGVAIRAAGEAPRLHVDLDLTGRRVDTVLQEGEIINNGGVTTLLVNDVLLHDEATGATGRTVLNGAWDLTLRASDTVAGRDFSARDFSETYAPRAAVYEALPGLLLRLHSRGPAGERLSVPGSPAWVRVAGGGGRYTPVQASVGATYDYRRVEVEAGLDVELGPRLTGTLSVRHVYGWGGVSSPTGGGEINARGLGGAVGVAWTGPRGYYFRGRISVMDYDVDLTADRRGTLIKEASAVGHSLGFETGRRFTLSERIKLTPRVWVTRSKIDLGFTDAVQSRLWAEDSDRLTGGTGLVAETACSWDDGAQAFAVRGSLDLWRTLGDGTAVNVSQGAPLKSVSDKTRVLLSLGGVYRWGRFSVSSEVAAGGPGSRDQEYAGFLNLGVQF